jgi:hypothetical protein
MCGFRHFPATGLLFPLFLDCFVCFEAVTVTGKNESGAFFPYFLRVGELFLSVRFLATAGYETGSCPEIINGKTGLLRAALSQRCTKAGCAKYMRKSFLIGICLIGKKNVIPVLCFSF